MRKCIERLFNGLIKENPTFVLMLAREEVVEAAGDDAEAEAFGVEHSGVFLAVHAVLLCVQMRWPIFCFLVSR